MEENYDTSTLQAQRNLGAVLELIIITNPGASTIKISYQIRKVQIILETNQIR